MDLLLNQVSTNTTDLTSLQVKLDGRVSSHIDVREALLKQKDQQLIGKTQVIGKIRQFLVIGVGIFKLFILNIPVYSSLISKLFKRSSKLRTCKSVNIFEFLHVV